MNRRKHPRPTDEVSPKRRKFVACQRCHAHKIKCSGDQPCAKCRQVGCADTCQYAPRDRQVKVSESYLQQLLAENRQLRRSQPSPSASATEADQEAPGRGPSRPAEAPDHDESNPNVRNPLIGDRAWFHPYDPSAPPIFVGEAACTAFATRFRRFLTGSNATAHIPRTQYVEDYNIAAANTGEVAWPSLQQARLLLKIALRQIGFIYHLVLRRSTLEKLEEIYQTGDFACQVNQCKFFALFAFGEAYSMRKEPSSGSRVPGTKYFARALSLVQVLPERTSITHLETLLLLVCFPVGLLNHANDQSLFSYYLNRRHSAYVLIGSAMRLGLTIGMNHNVPETQIIDPVERQHRVRIWWTIYIFDRMWGSKMGLPSQILDDDIHLDMPCNITPPALHEGQFSDTEYLKANITLARIVGETIAKLYSRRKYSETFLQRVQKLLKALKNWVETLPAHLRLDQEEPEMSRTPVGSLHLSFNQCVILTTRPTLLHILIKLSEDTHREDREEISQPVLTLGEACIHAARHSHSIILRRWINGTLPTFGFFHAHYLFSAALVLATSSLTPIGNPADLGAFETGIEVLRAMSENGNLAASEFYLNLEQAKCCLDRYLSERRRDSRGRLNAAAAIGPGTVSAVVSTPTSTNPHNLVEGPGQGHGQGHGQGQMGLDFNPNTPGLVEGGVGVVHDGFTTAMAFLEPTMQDFLAQSDFDLGMLHPVDTFMNEENVYAMGV
ncbi:fungal-specific transcription factor [Aspergillus heteromorphus CBS 117.55]|uniref:Fungal-specific transcription factor n=1 Tax=Aspergillus heteromorphus CBS 117.55 TaxID=1448321 RepID=A0A317W8E0_9EURO|nr:fungal-specific transcription factor [Aspergillus heteromorphus CBS 117.55]PWY82175.1 fungal-specific transcription factor [Aspergillus heteromorphus CBS 117.55]